MTFSANVVKYMENTQTGMARAEVDVIDDVNPTVVLVSLVVHDKIADMDARIKADLKQCTDQIKDEAEVAPPQASYNVDDSGVVS